MRMLSAFRRGCLAAVAALLLLPAGAHAAEYAGIGATVASMTLRQDALPEYLAKAAASYGYSLNNAVLSIKSLAPGGPAEQAGMAVGDLLLLGDGKAPSTETITGAEGTRVKVVWADTSAGAVRESTLTRQLISGSEDGSVLTTVGDTAGGMRYMPIACGEDNLLPGCAKDKATTDSSAANIFTTTFTLDKVVGFYLPRLGSWLVGLMVLGGVLGIVWGGVQMVLADGDEDKWKDSAKMIGMAAGAIAVALLAYVIVAIFARFVVTLS